MVVPKVISIGATWRLWRCLDPVARGRLTTAKGRHTLSMSAMVSAETLDV